MDFMQLSKADGRRLPENILNGDTMRKTVLLLSVILLFILAGCATLKSEPFYGTVGGVYISPDSYLEEGASADYSNKYSEFKPALWMYENTSKCSTYGNKVLFYADLEDSGFCNELVPDRYRAHSLNEAGFIIIAEKGHENFYKDYRYQSGGNIKVYYGTGTLKLYSIKTGELLAKSSPVNGPTPPESFYVSGGSVTWWDYPQPSAFKSSINSLCKKLANGRVSYSVKDTAVMTEETKTKTESIVGEWVSKQDDVETRLTFTADGVLIKAVFQEEVLISLEVSDYGSMDEGDYSIENKKLYIFDMVDQSFTRKSSKVEKTNTEKSVRGVWKGVAMDYDFIMGFTTDGLCVFQGSENGLMYYAVIRDGELNVSGKVGDFMVVNNVLYYNNEELLDVDGWVRLENVSTGGLDHSTFEVLTSGEWDYKTRNGEDGHIYTFYSEGDYTDVYYNLTKTNYPEIGTFTFDDHIVKLSTGKELVFSVIDETPIGYSM